ncbi:hypothetical protein G3O08_01665 [Cryomorpha ignava]|uniref:Secreted protein n=1 Tax=Cryomorpha ignava TaxID=101383 RepID=A0A7K3WKN4_9FLAO|nr:hypothetical protein [Cryomorpha ignava]NEN22210.1 hypothetical protein [Cryomorpha ignava]
MNLKSLIALFPLATLISITAGGQINVTIEDPDISFSYYLPEGYANQDDDLYHYIYPESEKGIEESTIQLTYFQGYYGELSVFKDGILNGKLRNTLENFEFDSSGSDTIDGTIALWSKYAYTEDSIRKCGELYCFERLGQYFQIQVELACSDESKYNADFKRIIRSLRVSKNF